MNLKNNLYTHEWLAVLSIVGLMGILTLLSQCNPSSTDNSHPRYVVDPVVTVFVEGEVENPGRFELKRGSRMKDLMDRIRLLPSADAKKVRLEAKLRDGQVVKIRPQKVSRTKKKGSETSPE